MPSNRAVDRYLRFAQVAPGRPFHAAGFISAGGGGHEFEVHSQDFYDVMCVVHGHGTHRVNDGSVILKGGDITLVRPGDVHSLSVAPGAQLHFFNLAFPARTWHEFGRLAGVESVMRDWDAAPEPPLVQLDLDRRPQCQRLCATLVQAHREGPRALELCRFWVALLGWMQPGESVAPGTNLPDWLERARVAMAGEENLRCGLPRLVELCHVSQPHLCRSVRAAFGVSPTEWINDLRLRRAAHLLAETDRAVAAIGADCGFENASYFHRTFKTRYALTPRAYRLRARSTVF